MQPSRDLICSKRKQIDVVNPKHAMVFLRCMANASPDDARLYFELAKTICAKAVSGHTERTALACVLAFHRLEYALHAGNVQAAIEATLTALRDFSNEP